MQDNLICDLCERVIQSPKASRLLQTFEDCCLIDHYRMAPSLSIPRKPSMS